MEEPTRTNNNNNNIDASTTNETMRTHGMVDNPRQPLPHHLRVVEVVPASNATDHTLESSNTAVDADTTTVQHPPPRKKQKVRRKPPPPTERVTHLPEESKLQTPTNAGTSAHGSGFRSETRLTYRTETAGAPDMAMPRQTQQFFFSPRHPTSSATAVPGEARLPTRRSGDDILHRLRPIEHNDMSIYSASRPSMNETDNSVYELVASLPMSSSLPLHHFASMSTSSPTRRLQEINHRSHLGVSPQSHILQNTLGQSLQLTRPGGFIPTSDALLSTVLGSVSNRTHNVAALDSNSHFALAASQRMGLTNNNSIGIATPLSLPPRRTANQILEDMLRQQHQEPQTVHDPFMDALVAVGNVTSASTTGTNEEQRPSVPRTTPSFTLRLPAILGHSTDILQMNDHQAYLRQQIEVFQATQDDLYANTRGRNKRIHVGQVGIRCRHCAHIPARQRQKGTVYFPATMRGLYQAAQNMSTNHIQCGLCTEMPENVKAKFVELWPTKNRVSRAGARYWEEEAKRLGLVDTQEDGIAFQPNPPGP